MGVKKDVAAARVYMEELRDQVLQGLKSGKTVDELSATVTMENYKDWASYDQWLALNIQGMERAN